MPKINFELTMAALIPDFIYQFLMSGLVDTDQITCLELEDIRDAVYSADLPELQKIRDFLAIESGPPSDEVPPEEGIDDAAIDADLAEVDSEYFHRYTPGELRFIFGEIMDNIELVYGIYREYTGLNLSLSIDFRFKDGPESNMIIEFLELSETPEYLEDVYFLPIKNYLISDTMMARVYFNFDPEYTGNNDQFFDGAIKAISFKEAGNGHNGLH